MFAEGLVRIHGRLPVVAGAGGAGTTTRPGPEGDCKSPPSPGEIGKDRPDPGIVGPETNHREARCHDRKRAVRRRPRGPDAVRLGAVGGLSDGQLLERFARRRRRRRPRRRSRRWSRGTGRWSGGSAGASWATRTTPPTPSRPPSWSWSARPARSGSTTRSAAGSTGSAARSRPAPGRRPPARSRERDGVESIAGPAPRPGRAEMLAELDAEIGRLPGRYRRCRRALRPRGPVARGGGPATGLRGGDRRQPAVPRPRTAPGPADPPRPGALAGPARRRAAGPCGAADGVGGSTTRSALRLVAGDAGSVSAKVSRYRKGWTDHAHRPG